MIKNTGLNNLFLWKYLNDSFETDAKLFVPEYQDAVFCREDRCLDILSPGDYKLNAETLPLLSEDLLSENITIKAGEKIPCDIYFVNKGFVASVMWGSGVPITISFGGDNDQLPFVINGEICLRVLDSKKFLEAVFKEYGQDFRFDQRTHEKSIRRVILNKIRGHLSGIISDIDLISTEIIKNINYISPKIRKIISYEMKKYGLETVGFSINKFLVHKNKDVALNNFNQNPVVASNGMFNQNPVIASKGTFNQNPVMTPNGMFNQSPIMASNGAFNQSPVMAPNGMFNQNPVIAPNGMFNQNPVMASNGMFNQNPAMMPNYAFNQNQYYNAQEIGTYADSVDQVESSLFLKPQQQANESEKDITEQDNEGIIDEELTVCITSLEPKNFEKQVKICDLCGKVNTANTDFCVICGNML